MRTLLTELDLQSLKWLLTPEIANIILGRALFASRVMLPIMKDAAKAEKTTAWLTAISEYEGQITKFAKEPALLANETLKRKDQNSQKISSKPLKSSSSCPRRSTRTQKKHCNWPMSQPATSATTKMATKTFQKTDPTKKKRKNLSRSPPPLSPPPPPPKEILDLSCPSSSQTKEPAPAEKALIHIADAAKAFLFHQEKHNRSWSGSANREGPCGNFQGSGADVFMGKGSSRRQLTD